MSQPAKKRPTPPTALPVEDGDGSGRFVIAHRLDPMLPPSNGQGDEVLSLDAIGGMELPDAIDSTPPPAPNTVSGVFASGEGPRSDAEIDPIADGIASMRPYYTATEQQNERAELIVEDLSLRFDNPYAASSLVPPPRKPLPVGKIIGIAAAVIAIGAGAWFAGRTFESMQAHRAPVVATVPHVVAAPQAQPVLAAPAAEPTVAVAAPAPAAKIEAQVAVQAPAPVPAPVATKAAPAASLPAHEHAQPVAQHGSTVEAALSAVLKNEATEHGAAAPAAEPAAVAAAQAPAAPEPTLAAAPAEPAAAAPAASLGALPDLPTREEVVAGFEQVRAALDTCAAGKHGTVKIDATIANSGRVAQAVINGAFVGTPEGSCMARAVRGVRFPAFSQQSLKVSYPIAL